MSHEEFEKNDSWLRLIIVIQFASFLAFTLMLWLIRLLILDHACR